MTRRQAQAVIRRAIIHGCEPELILECVGMEALGNFVSWQELRDADVDMIGEAVLAVAWGLA